MAAEPQPAPRAVVEATDGLAPPRALIGFVTAAANAVLAFALLGELATVFANVIARTFFDTAFLWADEIAKLALLIYAADIVSRPMRSPSSRCRRSPSSAARSPMPPIITPMFAFS